MPMPAMDGEDDNNMTNPDVPTDLDMAAKVESQGRQLAEQERRLQDLERRLSGMAMDMGGVKEAQIVTVEDASPTEGNNTNRASLGRTPVDTATYEFEHSMWDAALLVFVSRSNFADMCILVTGCTLNFGLQIALLLTIFMDMIENKYEGSKVKEMLQYRVETGHASANFDTGKGQSLLQKLCGLDLWSFEQEEYQLMYDYLYKPVPGFVLSTLAIIIWVLTIMREYRRCIEQAMAVWHLPMVRHGPEIEEDGEESMVIVGIHPVKKVMMLICLSLFRLGVMFFLGVIGCQYLAWTDGLGDIVLNAVALAFVLDVDELVAEVLLTERLRSTLGKLEPLSCGKVMKKDQKCIPMKDVIRYLITIGLIVFSVIYFLMPFYSSINAASLALCGGYQDFSYTGGTSDSAKTIIFQPSSWLGDPYLTGCDDSSYDNYLKKYYNATLGTVATNRTLIDYNALRQKEVLNFAFGNTSSQGQKCPEGQFLSVAGEGAERRCISVPDILRANMDKEIEPGKDPNIPNCPRFTPQMDCTVAGTMLRETPSSGQHCLWTWFAQTCDGNPHDPHVYDASCNTVQEDALDNTCNMWEDVFKMANPLLNCQSRLYCNNDPIYDCLGMKIYIEVELNHTSYWDPFYDDTVTNVQGQFLDGVTTAFVNMANAKLKLSSLTREMALTAQDDVLNTLALEDLTLNKLTYAVGVKKLSFFIKPKDILSSQDFQTYLTAEVAKLNLQDPMSVSNATLGEPAFSTTQELLNEAYFTTPRPASDGGYGDDGAFDGADDGGVDGPDGGVDGPDGGVDGPDGGLDGPDGGVDGPDGGLDGPDGGVDGPDGGLDGPDGGGLDGPDGGGLDGPDGGGLDGPDGGGP